MDKIRERISFLEAQERAAEEKRERRNRLMREDLNTQVLIILFCIVYKYTIFSVAGGECTDFSQEKLWVSLRDMDSVGNVGGVLIESSFFRLAQVFEISTSRFTRCYTETKQTNDVRFSENERSPLIFSFSKKKK